MQFKKANTIQQQSSIKKHLLMGMTKISGDIFGETMAIVGAI